MSPNLDHVRRVLTRWTRRSRGFFPCAGPSSTSLGRRNLDGMNQGELAAVRPRLEEFAAEVFAPLARADQRDKGLTYLRGLLLDGRRKSMQPMAERLGVDHQGLQQFVSSS